MLCLLQGLASAPLPSHADKAEPFIPVTSHKSSDQLRAHYRSPDPSITEGRRRLMNNEAISAFPPSAEKKRMIDFLCLVIMCIGHQSIKYSLLQVGISCDGVEENWILRWRRQILLWSLKATKPWIKLQSNMTKKATSATFSLSTDPREICLKF